MSANPQGRAFLLLDQHVEATVETRRSRWQYERLIKSCPLVSNNRQQDGHCFLRFADRASKFVGFALSGCHRRDSSAITPSIHRCGWRLGMLWYGYLLIDQFPCTENGSITFNYSRKPTHFWLHREPKNSVLLFWLAMTCQPL